MHPVEMIRGFWDELWHLPWFFQLGLMWLVGAGGWKWWKQRLHAQIVDASVEWPQYRARVIAAQALIKDHSAEDNFHEWEGVLTYSYTIPGHELEVGEYRRRFFSEDEAEAWARVLQDQFLEVRVDPNDSKRSVWHESSFSFPPLPSPAPALEAEGNAWSVAAFVVLVGSCVGVGLAAWIQITCLFGRPVLTMQGNDAAFFGMHVGAMACAIAAPFVAGNGKMSKFRSQKDFFKGGSTESRLLQVLGFYYTAVFLYGWVRMGAHPNTSPRWGTLMFSAGWLAFYSTAAMSCWGKLRGRSEPS